MLTMQIEQPPLDLDTALAAYKVQPTPGSLSQVVTHLEPTINYALLSLNAQNDPVLKGEARLIAADAVKKFDPEYGTNIKTYVTAQLKKMNRVARTHRSAIKIPERYQLENHAIHKAEQDFIDEKGYEPSFAELSDWSKIPLQRITKLRTLPVSTSATNNPDAVEPEVVSTDYFEEAQDYLYSSLEPTDQKIFEHMTGYGGRPILTPAELATRLRLSQSSVSRRFARMMNDLFDMENKIQTTFSA